MRSLRPALLRMLTAGQLALPLPGAGDTAARWSALAAWGRQDLSRARLAEGHTDAVAILAEAGRPAHPGALYGVWAARSGGTGARLRDTPAGRVLDGTVRYCSGARTVDRALVVAEAPGADAPLLVEVQLDGATVRPDPDSWRTPAMAGADTLDVDFTATPLAPDAVVGDPGWYTARPGFAAGGGGVAAVWWGGAAGVLCRLAAHGGDDPHRLAHLGELHAELAAAEALLDRTAAAIDAGGDHRLAVAVLRSAVEHAVREVVDRVPRAGGVAVLSRDESLAGALADLALYVRQHHGERDHAALGADLLAADAFRPTGSSAAAGRPSLAGAGR